MLPDVTRCVIVLGSDSGYDVEPDLASEKANKHEERSLRVRGWNQADFFFCWRREK